MANTLLTVYLIQTPHATFLGIVSTPAGHDAFGAALQYWGTSAKYKEVSHEEAQEMGRNHSIYFLAV